MREALGDAFRKYFVIILLAACLVIVVLPPNPKTLPILHSLILDCLAGLISMFMFQFVEKNWQ